MYSGVSTTGPGISLLVLARLQKRRREETGPAGMGGALCIDPEAESFKLQA